MNRTPDPAEDGETRRRLAELQVDHNDLEVAIQAIGLSPVPELALKDEIQRLKDQLTPDIIA